MATRASTQTRKLASTRGPERRRPAPCGTGLRQRLRELSGSASDRRDLLRDRRLAVRGLVLVDDTLAHGLVELAGRLGQRLLGGGLVAGRDSLAGLADERLQLALDGLVALVRLLVGLVALDLRLDVRHVETFFRFRSDRLSAGLRERAVASAVVRAEPTRKPITESIRCSLLTRTVGGSQAAAPR